MTFEPDMERKKPLSKDEREMTEKDREEAARLAAEEGPREILPPTEGEGG